ncbi:hypothetical protein [Halalkalicoccus tibetensis]|uniref:Uncharacterized protein n=1 Tax=Halalkalicoccus tibetensis TaxID=175632 RepID=A0ABD5V490_9EURY
MRSDPNQRRARTDPDREASPSGGWRAVYAAMGISPDGATESQRTEEERRRTDSQDSPTPEPVEGTRETPARP